MTVMLDFSLVAPGGSTTYATAFLQALGRRSDIGDVVVVVSHRLPDLEAHTRSLTSAGARVHVLRFGSGWATAAIRQLALPILCVRFGARVLYCPREVAPIFAPARLVILARNLKVWSRTGSRGPLAQLLWVARLVVASVAVARSGSVIAVSNVMRLALPARFRSTVTVVHHGCDLELIAESEFDQQPGEVLRVVSLGTVSEHKHFEILIDAIQQLRDLGQPAELAIWGPTGNAAYAELVRRCGLQSLGYDPLHGPADPTERLEILRHADVLALGSSWESFGMPLVEGMRTSCLVWAPSSPIVVELCGDVAVSYTEGDPTAAARSLLGALPTASARLTVGRSRSMEFTWDSSVAQTLAVLRTDSRSIGTPRHSDRNVSR